MFQNAFARLDKLECETILKEINPAIEGSPFVPDTVTILGQELSFYPGYYFYDIADHETVPNMKRYVIYKPGTTIVLDWTNAPIYKLNDSAPIILDEQNINDYLRFFLTHVRGKHSAFTVTESIDDILWIDDPSPGASKAIRNMIKPSRLIGRGENGSFDLEVCAIYKNALLEMAVNIMPDGTVEIKNEKILADELPVNNDELMSS